MFSSIPKNKFQFLSNIYFVFRSNILLFGKDLLPIKFTVKHVGRKRNPYFLTASAPFILILPAKRAKLESRSFEDSLSCFGMSACLVGVPCGCKISPNASKPEKHEYHPL